MKMKKKLAGGILAFSLASQALVLPIQALASSPTQIEATAKDYMGVPYVWGGTSPSGFDCSGYIQYVFKQNGISMPRTAAEQYNVGTSVSKGNLQKGDLVYFTTYKAGPSHVGIYLGNGQFINASSSKGVSIASLSSSYWANRYIGAKRVLSGNSSPTANIEVEYNKNKTVSVGNNQGGTTIKQNKVVSQPVPATAPVEVKMELNKDGKTYTVKETDTLYDIAKEFDVTWERVMQLNELDSTVIHKGQVLTIKGQLKPTISLFDPTEEQSDVILPKSTLNEDEDFLNFTQTSIERAEAATAIQYLLTTYGVERDKVEETKQEPKELIDIPETYWAKDSIEWAVEKQYMNVDDKGLFNPKQLLTADEANQILTHILEDYALPKEQKTFIEQKMKEDPNFSYQYIENLIFNITNELTSEKVADESKEAELQTEEQSETVSPIKFLAKERATKQMTQSMILSNATFNNLTDKTDKE